MLSSSGQIMDNTLDFLERSLILYGLVLMRCFQANPEQRRYYMAGDKVVEFTDGNFETEVLNAETPVLVDFWATWCAPCKAIAPVVEELSETYAGKVKIGKVNVDENPATPGQYGVRGIPTMILFKGGQVVDQLVGAVPKNQLEGLLKKAL